MPHQLNFEQEWIQLGFPGSVNFERGNPSGENEWMLFTSAMKLGYKLEAFLLETNPCPTNAVFLFAQRLALYPENENVHFDRGWARANFTEPNRKPFWDEVPSAT